MAKIKNALKKWLDDEDNTRHLSIPTVKALIEVMEGTGRDFVIFNNGGGQEFHIWVFDKMDLALLEKLKSYIICFSINGDEVISSSASSLSWILGKYLKGE